MDNLLPRPVRSVLVLTKHRFLGDTIVAIPLLRATRQVYPEAHITLLTGCQAADALKNCPYVDTIVAYAAHTSARTVTGSLRLTAALIQRMVGEHLHNRPDVCLVADRSFRAAMAARLAGGRVRAGFDTEGRGWLLTHPVAYDPDRHEADCCLDILRALAPEGAGEPHYSVTPELWTTDTERVRGGQILAEHGVRLSRGVGPLIGIQPGASHRSKQWSEEQYAALARALVAQTGGTIILMGYGPNEREASRQVGLALGERPYIDLTGKTKLRETMGVLTHLSLFVGNDTGVNHIAAALGVPTVALFGPIPAHKWGNIGPHSRVLIAPDDDMARITTPSVVDAALSLLDGVRHPVTLSRPADPALALGASKG